MPFVLLVGENGLGPWEALEYVAQDQHVKLLESQVVLMTIRRHGKESRLLCALPSNSIELIGEYQRTGRSESGVPRPASDRRRQVSRLFRRDVLSRTYRCKLS
jgi:hypothetical protein